MKEIYVLVACEESQRVCNAFRDKGATAFSCDIQECSGGHPEWHIKSDVLPILNGNYCFMTQDKKLHSIKGKWDLIIAHPPCTYLTNTGNRWFNEERYGVKAKERKEKRNEALEFVKKIYYSDCPLIVIENPIGFLSTNFKKPSQIIQPYYFAETETEAERKATCLWIKGNLPLLRYNIKFNPLIIKFKNGKTDSKWHLETINLPTEERRKNRSKTFRGIAKAMADQWYPILVKEKEDE